MREVKARGWGDRMAHRIGFSAVLLLLATAPLPAQEWPARAMEMIIPWAAGGGVDIVGRAMANAMGTQLRQSVVVVNRDGAAGTLGFNTLAAAAPDGYTLGGGPTTPIANAPYLIKGVRYGVDDFEYICQYFENIFALAVRQNSPLKSAEELFAAARAAPGTLTYGHAGVGSIPHLAAENLAESLGLKFQHVPFRGDAPLLPNLLKGEIDFASVALASIRGLDLRVLAVFADARRPNLPETPTARELGVARSVPPGHNGVFTPKGTAQSVRARLETACANAAKSPSVGQAVGNVGGNVTYLTGEEFRLQTVADHQFKGELIRRLGLEAK